MNPFETLELKPGASAEDVKAAYHRLAKQWHPDRFDGVEKAKAEQIFREISEAFAQLRDPIKRQQLEQQAGLPTAPKTEPPKPSPVERTPNDWFEEAKKELESGDSERAMGLVQYAIRLDGQRPEYHLLMAQMLENQGKDKRLVVKAYETAFQLNGKDVDVAIRLGELYQTLGMQARAQRMFQTAQELAPRHKYFKKAPQVLDSGKAKQDGAEPGGMMNQVKSLWNRLARKG